MSKFKIKIFSLFFFCSGLLFQIFQGYKNETFIDVISFALIFTAWWLLYTTYFSHLAFDEPRKIKGKTKSLSLNQKLFGFFSKIVFGAFVILTFMLANYLQGQRVIYILKTGKTNTVVAKIDNLEFRFGKGHSRRYVLFKYLANGELVTQPIYDAEKQYLLGQEVRIRYSVDYPKMFETISTLKTK